MSKLEQFCRFLEPYLNGTHFWAWFWASTWLADSMLHQQELWALSINQPMSWWDKQLFAGVLQVLWFVVFSWLYPPPEVKEKE